MFFDFKKNRAWAENLTIVTQLGLTMAGCIAFCFFIGLYLDKWLGTKGLFLTIFIILGVIGGGVTVYRQILEITESEKDREKDKEDETYSENGIDPSDPEKILFHCNHGGHFCRAVLYFERSEPCGKGFDSGHGLQYRQLHFNR